MLVASLNYNHVTSNLDPPSSVATASSGRLRQCCRGQFERGRAGLDCNSAVSCFPTEFLGGGVGDVQGGQKCDEADDLIQLGIICHKVASDRKEHHL